MPQPSPRHSPTRRISSRSRDAPKGRREIASFHQRIFDTVVKGTRLQGEVKFVRLLNAVLGVMHSVVRVTLQRQTEVSPSRDSIQLTVVAKRDGEWRSEGLMNARRLTMERQLFLDDIDSLPAEAQRQVTDLVASLKKFSSVDRTVLKR